MSAPCVQSQNIFCKVRDHSTVVIGIGAFDPETLTHEVWGIPFNHFLFSHKNTEILVMFYQIWGVVSAKIISLRYQLWSITSLTNSSNSYFLIQSMIKRYVELFSEKKLGQCQSQTPFSSAFWLIDWNLISIIWTLFLMKKFVPKKLRLKLFGQQNI